jgi:hypothetical protein
MADTGFLLAEDDALKKKVSGLTVPNDKVEGGQQTVPVRFRHPEGESDESGGIQYPLITIDLLSITYHRERDHVNNVDISYVPDRLPTVPGGLNGMGVTEYPLPVRLLYQIQTWTVNARQDRYLIAQMLKPDRLPLRHGWLYVEADDTIRLMESLGTRKEDMIDAQRRRIFRTTYSVRVEAEMLKTTLVTYGEVVNVILDPLTNAPDEMLGI